jgi:RHS repeat-associated protein
MRRRIAVFTALAVGMSLGIPPEVIPEGGGWPVSGLLSPLRQAPGFAAVAGLPKLDPGNGAADGEHYVDADQTRADGGAGKAPGRGTGVTDPELPAPPSGKAGTTPKKGGDADSFDPKTSKRVAARSTATYDEFQNLDGSYTRRLYDTRVNFKAADGTYQPIDTRLNLVGDRLEAGANSIEVTLGTTGTDEPAPATAPTAPAAGSLKVESADEALAAVTTAAGHTLAYDLAGAADVTADVHGSVATYPEILPLTDLELESTKNGLKETIVLESPAAGNEWVFPLRLEGLTPKAKADGSIDLLDASGRTAMRIPPGYMEDSKVDPASGDTAQSSDVDYELITVDGGPALKVTADKAWLQDPARQYPVRVDPSVTTQTYNTGDVYVDNSSSTVDQNDEDLPVGTWNGTSAARSFMHFDEFDNDGLLNTQIKSAKLKLYHTWSYNCVDFEPFYVRRITTAWTVASLENNAGLAAGPKYSAPIGTGLITNNAPACNNQASDPNVGAWRTVTLNPATFNGWSLGTMKNFGLALTASESNAKAFKRFTSRNEAAYAPYLEIVYDDNEAPQVDEMYPGYGQAATTLTPTLIADAHDPDNWPTAMTTMFRIYPKTGTTPLATSGWTTRKTWTVPTGVLKWGESYFWEVQVSDTKAGNGDSLFKHLLVTPVPQPAATGALSQNADKGFDAVSGNYTTSARDAMVNTAGPPLEINRLYNSSDPRTDQAFGAGWSSVVDTKLVEKFATIGGRSVVNTVVVTYPTGRELAFGHNLDTDTNPLNDTYASPAGRTTTLSAITVGAVTGYRLAEKDGTTYEFLQPLATGKLGLSTIKDLAGREQTFTYTDNLVSTITSKSSGRALDLYWTSTTPKRVNYVATDPVVPGDWDTANTWWYDYTDGRLTKVCPPTNWGECHTYEYNASASQHPAAVANAKALSYWRLNETGGTTAASTVLDNGGRDNGTYTGVTLGQPGPLTGSGSTAAAFNGTSSQVSVPVSTTSDTSYQSVSMWFKTSGGSGVLYGQSWDPITSATTTAAYNPTLYLGTDGRLMGGFPKATKPGTALGSIQSQKQGGCITAPDFEVQEFFSAYLDDCSSGANQQWTYTAAKELRVTVGGATRCMALDNADVGKGVDVVIENCNAQDYQKWDLNGDGQLVNIYAGSCVHFPQREGAGSVHPLFFYAVEIWPCDKKLRAEQGFFPRNGQLPLETAASVADGNWHHVVLSAGGNKQELFLDGNQVDSETGVTLQDLTAARSYIGAGFLGGGRPNQPHANARSVVGTRDYFTGSIAEVALWDTATDPATVKELRASGLAATKPMTRALRPSGDPSATIAYHPASGRVSQVIDGNGATWTPKAPTVTGTSKVYESAVLGGAPTNYWRMAEGAGRSDAVNEVNGNTATYNAVGLGTEVSPLGTAAGKAATFNGTNAYVKLPAGTAPAKANSVSMWFKTTAARTVLLGEADAWTATANQVAQPTLWITADGKLRGLAPSRTTTGPVNSIGSAGKCMDVPNSNSADGTNIQLYTCNGTAAQNWTFVPTDATTTLNSTFYVKAFGKCLTPYGGSGNSGTKLTLWTCNGNESQKWFADAGGLTNSHGWSTCLDNPGNSKTNGTILQLYTCNASPAQTWLPSLTSKAKVNDGKWHHVVLATDGFTQTLYVDGTKAQSSSGTAELVPDQIPTRTLGSGYANGWMNNWFYIDNNKTTYYTGSLAEVAFYGSVIDEAQASYQFKARDAVTQSASGQVNYTVQGPGGDETTVVHDLMYGRKVADVDALKNTTRYGYSGKGFLRSVTDPLGNMVINEHDVRGNVVAVSTCQDRSANLCSTAYTSYYPDATTENPPAHAWNDRPTALRAAGSASAGDNTYLTTYAYDAKGNRISETDPLGRKTLVSYTDGGTAGGFNGGTAPAGLPWRVIKPGGSMQIIRYLPSGDVAETVDPAGQIMRYEYDGLGRVTREIEILDAAKGTVGSTTSYTHDRLDRVVTVADTAITNAVTGAVHTPLTTVDYNVDGLVTAETVADLTGGDASRKVSYEYDAFGRRDAEIDQNGNRLEIGYDAYGRVNRQKHSDDSVVRTDYDANGNELRTVVEGWTGDPNAPKAPTDLVFRSLKYDAAGRVASETDALNVETAYTYTDNNLLVSVTRKDTTGKSFVLERNTYDATGSVTTQVTNNGLTTTRREYDKAGRSTIATLDPAGLNRSTAYEYSPEDEIVRTTVKQGTTILGRSDSTYDRVGRVRQQTSYLTDGSTPAVRWKLDETTGTTTADAAGNNIGVLGAGVTRSTERGGSASFNGTAAGISGRAPVDTTRPYTLGVWAKLAAEDADRHVAVIPGDLGSSALKLYYQQQTDSWQYTMSVRKDNGDTAWVSSAAPSGTGTLGAWTHLAVTVDTVNRRAQLYINGVAAGAAVTTTEHLNNRATGLRLGSETDASGFFSGQIDDLQIYQDLLDSTAISTVMNSTTVPSADAKVSRVTYGLTADGSVTSVTDPRGSTAHMTLDEIGRAVVTTTPAVGTVTGENNPVTSVSTSRVGFNTFGEAVEQQDPLGNVTISRYDGLGQIVENQLPDYTAPGSSSPIKAKTTVEYDEVGQILATTDPLGARTTYLYDQLGRNVRVTAPDGGETRYVYDLDGDLLEHTDPNGATVREEFDYLGRTEKSTQIVRGTSTSAQHVTTYKYGTDGEYPWPTSVVSPTGVTGNIKYNIAGEQIEIADSLGNTTRTAYDGAGRPVRTTAPDGSFTNVAYDLGGRMIRSADYAPGGTTALRTRAQHYDVAGNTVGITDARGTYKHFEYDAVGQLVMQREPISSSDAIVTRFGYDRNGNQTRFTDGRGNNFITTYNSWNLPESQIEPATTATPNPADRTFTTAYDAGGRMTRLDSPGGVSVTSTYDTMGRLEKSSGTGAQVTTADKTFTYDKAGRLTSFTGSAGTNTVAYDDRGLITNISGVSGNSAYEYNADGSLTKRVDGAGTTTYQYDPLGRPANVQNTTAGVNMTYGYNNLSQVETIAYGGNTRTLKYDTLKRLSSDELKTSAGASVGKIAYEWNANDSLTKKTTTGFNGASANTYTYDLADRMVGWDNGVTPAVYAYDKSGNRVQAGTKTFTYDQRNQLTVDSDGTTYQYTARGTLASTIQNGQTVETTTDAFNQVVSQGGKSGGRSTYTYDGLGRVIQPNLTYTGVGNDVAADGSSVYVRDIADQLVGVSSSAGNRYAWTDAHTDVVGEFTATGAALTGSVSYDPWGKVLASGGMTGRLGYQQEWTDQTTGKVNMWSRWYDPETGAFDSRDTATNSPTPTSGSANRFAYAEGDPMSNTDTTGNAVDGKCGEYDYACALKKYQAELAVYTKLMEQRDRDMQAAGSEIARQEAEYQRAERESNIPVVDILMQVAGDMILDMIGYNSIVGCIAGSLMDCVDLAISVLGPGKVWQLGRSLYRALDRAFGAYRTWKRIVEAARSAMQTARGLVTQARKHLSDLMSKKIPKPKPPKKKKKPPTKKKKAEKQRKEAKAEKKPAPSKQSKKQEPRKSPKKSDNDKPKKGGKANKDPKSPKSKKDEPRKKNKKAEEEENEAPDQPETCPTHSFDPATRVLMADGTTRPISEINLGDEVQAKDPTTGEEGARPVTLLHSNRDIELTDVTVSDQPLVTVGKPVNEGKGDRSTRGPTGTALLETTAHHPFWDATTGAWVNAADLVAGESTLVGPDGQIQYVIEVRNHTGAKVMRDLTVDDIHTYYVVAGKDPVLVHNNNPGSPATPAACPVPSVRGTGPSSRDPDITTSPALPGWTVDGQLRKLELDLGEFAMDMRTSKTASRTYVGAVNTNTGTTAMASSGGWVGCLSYCAEGNALLALGGNPDNVIFTMAVQVVRSNKGLKAVPKLVCKNCQVDFPDPNVGFVPGIRGEPGGLWGH